MIIDLDLEKQGDKKMFISERLESIKMNEHGGWTVRFKYSSGFYQYNKARLLLYMILRLLISRVGDSMFEISVSPTSQSCYVSLAPNVIFIG